MISIDIEGDDFSLLYKRVKAFDKELAKATRRRLTDAATPVRDDVRAAALALPSRGGGATTYRKKRGVAGGAGFRQGIAAATEIKVMPERPGHFAVRIRVSGSKFAAKTGKPVTLPRYMEGLSKKSWRHPVFVKRADLPGPAGRWVAQSPHAYLLPTASRHKPAVQTAVKKALQDAVDTVLNSRM
jgi:hypothetical protein